MQQLKVWSFEKNPGLLSGTLLAEHCQVVLPIKLFGMHGHRKISQVWAFLDGKTIWTLPDFFFNF